MYLFSGVVATFALLAYGCQYAIVNMGVGVFLHCHCRFLGWNETVLVRHGDGGLALYFVHYPPNQDMTLQLHELS